MNSYISQNCKAIDTELEVPFCFDALAYHLDMHFSYVLFALRLRSWPRQHKK